MTSRSRLNRVARVAVDGRHVCPRCDGTGIDPATVGGESPEARQRKTAQQALAEMERKVERQREVRAALGDGVVDVKLVDELPPKDDDGERLRLVGGGRS